MRKRKPSPVQPTKQIQAHDVDTDIEPGIPEDPSIDINNLKKRDVILASKADDSVVITEESKNISPQLRHFDFDELSPAIGEITNPDAIEIEYPNKSSLVLNALLAGLEDENTLVQRITLDFMHSHFKLSGDLFSVNEKCHSYRRST